MEFSSLPHHGDGPILFFVFPAGSSMAHSISQDQTEASGLVGDILTLPCTYSTSYTYYYLFWYKQPPTGEMIYLIVQGSSVQENSRTGRYSVSFQKAKKSFSLTITVLQPEDSGVYFCALSEVHSERTGRRTCTKTPEP
uniref:Ig-like domain-containing protein n=1 Tax=Ornithorhynchus anatinus TaxID=9258 RepID=F6YWV4_ORNAN